MVYYLRSKMSEPTSSESTSEPSTLMTEDTEKMMEKYYPCFMYSICVVAITFLVLHLLVRFFSPKFLCKLDENGNVILRKEGEEYGYMDHRKAYYLSGMAGVLTIIFYATYIYSEKE